MDSKKMSSKDEERNKKELEYLPKIKEIETEVKDLKAKRENLLQNFVNLFKRIAEIGSSKIKNPEVLEEIYLVTGRMIEISLMERDFNFTEKLNENEIIFLVKFYYLTYERFTTKKPCLSLKPGKIYNAHYNLLNKSGIGTVHRSLFSIMK